MPQVAVLRVLLATVAVLRETVPFDVPLLAGLVVKITRLVELVATVILTVDVSKCGESIGNRDRRCDTGTFSFKDPRLWNTGQIGTRTNREMPSPEMNPYLP